MSLPSGYKRLEYIQSTGTQYIDAGFKPNQYTNMEVKFSTSAGTGMGAVAATQDKLGTNGYGVDISACVYADLYIVSYRFAKDVEHIAKIIDGVFYDNGVQVWSNSGKVFSSNYNLTICGYMSGGVVSQYYTGRIYYLKIWQSGILFRDYIPCQTTSGGIGLWDDVNSVFYGNAGTGTFTAGPVIAIAADKSEITKLEYIQSSGTQYINTGFKPNNNTRVVMDLLYTGNESISNEFGAWNSSNNASFICLTTGKNNLYPFYGNTSKQVLANRTARHTVDMDKNVVKMNGTTMITFNQMSFQCIYPMFLCCFNNAGATENMTSMRIYSCQIHDNGTLIRNYIPAKLSDGTVGLYDKLNGLLYINSGTGTFEAGPSSLNLPVNIGGAWKDANEAFVNIGGTWKTVEAAFVNIGGTWKELG